MGHLTAGQEQCESKLRNRRKERELNTNTQMTKKNEDFQKIRK